MFPLKSSDPYINDDGSRSTLGDLVGAVPGIEGDIEDIQDAIGDTDISDFGADITSAITAIGGAYKITSLEVEMVSITTDGIKTFQQIQKDMIDAYNAYVTEHPGQYLITSVLIAGARRAIKYVVPHGVVTSLVLNTEAITSGGTFNLNETVLHTTLASNTNRTLTITNVPALIVTDSAEVVPEIDRACKITAIKLEPITT